MTSHPLDEMVITGGKVTLRFQLGTLQAECLSVTWRPPLWTSPPPAAAVDPVTSSYFITPWFLPINCPVCNAAFIWCFNINRKISLVEIFNQPDTYRTHALKSLRSPSHKTAGVKILRSKMMMRRKKIWEASGRAGGSGGNGGGNAQQPPTPPNIATRPPTGKSGGIKKFLKIGIYSKKQPETQKSKKRSLFYRYLN